MSDTIACWSLHQPYALLVALGWKEIETRPRRTWHRADVGICASIKRDEAACERLAARAEARGMSRATWDALTSIVGRALAVVRVVDCRPLVPSDEARAWFYADGRYAYELTARRVVDRPPVVKGKQGTFYVPAELLAASMLHRPGEITGVWRWLEQTP